MLLKPASFINVKAAISSFSRSGSLMPVGDLGKFRSSRRGRVSKKKN